MAYTDSQVQLLRAGHRRPSDAGLQPQDPEEGLIAPGPRPLRANVGPGGAHAPGLFPPRRRMRRRKHARPASTASSASPTPPATRWSSESKDPDHRGWIDIETVLLRVRGLRRHHRREPENSPRSGAAASSPSPSPAACTRSSPVIFRYCVTGEQIDEMRLPRPHLRRRQGRSPSCASGWSDALITSGHTTARHDYALPHRDHHRRLRARSCSSTPSRARRGRGRLGGTVSGEYDVAMRTGVSRHAEWTATSPARRDRGLSFAKDGAHRGWIDVRGFSRSVNQEVAPGPGTAFPRRVPSVSDFSLHAAPGSARHPASSGLLHAGGSSPPSLSRAFLPTGPRGFKYLSVRFKGLPDHQRGSVEPGLERDRADPGRVPVGQRGNEGTSGITRKTAARPRVVRGANRVSWTLGWQWGTDDSRGTAASGQAG